MSRQATAGYSPTQIGLHWVIAALVLFQIIFGDGIKDLGRALKRGTEPDTATVILGNLHIWFGAAILALTLWRLALRITRGAPAPAGGNTITLGLMKAAHGLFYALLLAMPVTGLVAWYLGVHDAGEIHEAMKPVFVLLIALHVLAVVWHRAVLKDDTMARMLRPGR
ncbi:cytochrome b [Pannonibacter carbonis]|uniref:cytochrome b n=1 Tax=Pannonibacter carbonis TaxID=2067569 RepID=UPI0018E595DA|nr:cytochrome b/b6 domain-containing protein [Pannonibacter carbonis]